MIAKRPHVSHSQVKNWKSCPRYHKLDKVDGLVPFKGSLFTAFGSAVHATAEYIFEDERWKEQQEVAELHGVFSVKFEDELKTLEKEMDDFNSPDTQKLVCEMKESGAHIASHIVPAMTKRFGDFKVLGIEEELRMPVPEYPDWDFLGYVDLIIESNGKIYICDWKTTSWGWSGGYNFNSKTRFFGPNAEEDWFPSSAPSKKSDKMVAYQLAYYKHYWMQKHGYENHKDVEVAFILLKRSPGKDKNGKLKNPVEFFEITCGKKKINNALNLLNEAVYNISNKRYWKNRLSCQKFGGYRQCIFNISEHCKRG